ncbi:5'-nucleotidase [Cystobasidium minutum MCA 4210]|uniref:5'-nucleotidase n=1 Tax=Cystobasidium minutum MCA 4210 TaxID=1397322 RepID=UPI0034CD0A05|eukprot:jgi/Rhomi1/171066/fgenesh1_kg.4_\
MKSHVPALGLGGALLSLIAVKTALADDYLVSERHNLYKRQNTQSKNITFLHINDVHAHLDEYRSSGTDCPRNTTENNNVTRVPCFGGYARIIEKANEIRGSVENSLFLNAGDEFQGTLFYSYYGGEVIADTINQANFSAFTIGNHEFDGGDDMLANFLNNLTVPAVSTNIFTDNALLRAQLHPYLYYPEHEMALVALTTVDVPGISSPGNGTTFAPYTSVQSTVDQLLQSRLGMGRGACKRVIALTHIGYENDIELAQNSRNIHLIIGGHSHTRLGNDSAAAGQYPTVVRNLDGEEVFVVTSWRWGQQLGRIDVEFEETTGKILSYTGAPINMTEAVAQDEEYQNQVMEWRQPFDEFNREVIGQTQTDLDQTTCQEQECTLGDAMTDAMVYYRNRNGGTVDFALHNAGGIRATIDAPEITRGEVLTAFPFGNQIVDIQFTGQQIWGIFEGIVSGTNSAGEEVTSFVQVSQECTFSYNPSNAVGSRLISMSIGGADIDFAKTYTITTLDFIVTGGDAFFPNATSDAGAALGPQDEVFVEYVQAQTPLNIQTGTRIVVTDQTTPEHTV